MAKLAGWKLCQAYRRQYGDAFITASRPTLSARRRFRPGERHVIPALIRRMHEAKLRGENRLTVWGTRPAARASSSTSATSPTPACSSCVSYDEAPINLGGGTELSIAETGRGHRRGRRLPRPARVRPSRPDGVPRKSARSDAICSPWAGGRRPTSAPRSPRLTAGSCTHEATEECQHERTAV